MQASPLKLDPIHLAIFESAPSQKGEIGILFFHGVGRRGRDFAPLFSSFAHDRPFWAVDARGHGASDRANGSYYIKEHAQDAIGVLEKITQSGTTPVVIFGHSMGALQAMAAAMLRPDLVRGLILEDPPGPRFLATLETNPYHHLFLAMQRFAGCPLPTAELARQLAEVQLPGATSSTSIRLGDVRDMASLRLSASCLKQVDPAVYDPLLAKNWLLGLDFDTMLKGIRCPVLLLAGEESRGGMLPVTEAERIASGVADCLWVRFPNTGHLIHWTATEACLANVHSFLESLEK